MILHEWAGRLQFRTVRILNDAAVVIAGALLGGTVGIGTLLSVVLTGPCIQLATAVLCGQLRIPADEKRGTEAAEEMQRA